MNPLLPLLMMLINWSVDATDPATQSNILTLFIAVHAALILVVVFLFLRVYLQPTPESLTKTVSVPLIQGGTEMEVITVQAYDLRKLRELGLTKILLPLGITIFIFNKWQIILPMLFQSMNNPMQLYGSELFQIHVMGKSPKDKPELVRPWTEAAAMPEWLSKTGNADNKKKDK